MYGITALLSRILITAGTAIPSFYIGYAVNDYVTGLVNVPKPILYIFEVQ